MMKKNPMVILALLALVAFAGSAENVSPRTVTVTGSADVKVVPDEVGLVVGISTTNKNLGTAKKDNEANAKKVNDTALKFKIDQKDIQTSQISINPKYEYINNSNVFTGYEVERTISFTLRDLSKFEDFLSAILDGGVNRVSNIQFRTSELRKHRDKARGLAITAAKEKAIALAEGLGQKIGKPITISEDVDRWQSWYGATAMRGLATQNVMQDSGGSAESEDSFSPGQITVSASVTVVFEML